MSYPERRAILARVVRGVAAGAVFSGTVAHAQVKPLPEPPAPGRANWALAEKFSSANMRGMTYSTSIQGRWVGETDSLFYSWSDAKGQTFYLVNAATRAKGPLFDHVKMAAQLSTLHRKAYDPNRLPFNSVNFTKDHKNVRFAVDSTRYNWNLATETLTRVGLYRGAQDSSLTADEETQGGGGGGGRGGGGGGRGGRGGPEGGGGQDWRNFSPDSTAFVFARNHNLFVVEVGRPDTMQVTTDGLERYSFAGGGGRGGQQDSTEENEGRGGRGNEGRTRPNVTWSGDSKSFYISRTDSRKVADLWVINVLSEPRPTLETYQYAMAGDEDVNQVEYWSYMRGERAAKKIPLDKWKDQRFFNATYPTKDGTKMRVIRRDRLQRNLEYIEVDLNTGAIRTLVTESVENANLEGPNPRYIKQGGDFIWFSERTGWGHFYLYGHDGTLKRALTSGAWRADQIVEVDSVRNLVYVRGQGREAGENPYYTHLYRVNLADASIALLDPGHMSFNSSLHPKQKYVIAQGSRVDTVPSVSLRDGTTGRLIMDLEKADLSTLLATGWQFPERFQTLAADGVTPIYGNIWKPFDFDSTKKYPIIAHVYPGPQTESVTMTFTSGNVPQELAQLGFIVIHIGNRGGHPARSNAYQHYSYFNLRDYALADKKAGIEQLADRHPWIDIERVGIFGHSGGGYLTGAALLLPPYNEFFKVGVSSAGNHDNNIYNQNWSEQYHGLRWVAAADTACLTAQARGRPCADGGGRGRGAAALAQAGRGGGGRGAGRGGGRGAPGGNGANGSNGEAAVPDSVFWIYVPTNIDLAPNLKGKLLLTTGEIDNNVHPGNTIRLVNALVQANKRFDYMVFPGQRHGFGPMQPYFNRMLMEYFAEHLLGDYNRTSSDYRE